MCLATLFYTRKKRKGATIQLLDLSTDTVTWHSSHNYQFEAKSNASLYFIQAQAQYRPGSDDVYVPALSLETTLPLQHCLDSHQTSGKKELQHVCINDVMQ